MGLLTTFRSAIVQASFNEKMANIVAKELAIMAVVGAVGLWYLFGWQWFFWGIFLCPVVLVMCLFSRFLQIPMVFGIAVLWAAPFLLLAQIIDAAYVGAAIAFFYCFWVHTKAITWSEDLARDESDDNVW